MASTYEAEAPMEVRIGFFPPCGREWTGGVNYYANVFTLISSNPLLNYKCVAFVPKNSDSESLRKYESVAETVPLNCLVRWHFWWVVRRVLQLIGVELLDWILRYHRVSLASHVTTFMKLSIPVIGWIPDFQHFRIPTFFSRDTVALRDREFKVLLREADAVILSSQAAKDDCIAFFGQDSERFRVLRFSVPKPTTTPGELEIGRVKEKYNLPKRFFHVPNQFWKHKNHMVVMQAVNVLRERGLTTPVVFTGSQADQRNAEYWGEVRSFIMNSRLERELIVLGLIEYSDMVSIMMSSIAVINPSFFEGWSTTVEEAKTLGRPMILSDITVHREQCPRGARFFDPLKSEELADAMEQVWKESSHNTLSDVSDRQPTAQDFLKQYIKIVDGLLSAST